MFTGDPAFSFVEEDDADHSSLATVEFFLNGAELSLNSANSGNLINH